MWLCAAGVVFSAGAVSADPNAYDPLKIPEGWNPRTVDLTVNDAQRQRPIPVWVYLPSNPKPAAVVLFSHGLGGACENNPYLGKHWAGRGYAAVFVQHPGSDTSVWQDKPPQERMAAMKKAANGQNFLLRVKDIPAVLDQIEQWNKTEGHMLQGRLDMSRVGMSGHSFGAVTTQAVSGQLTGLRQMFTDERIKAAVAFSPSSPKRGKPEKAFAKVSIPWMLMTGTKDVSMIGEADVKSRLAVFPALPPGQKYEVVLYNAEHSAFSDRPLPGDTEQRNPNHHRVILALSTAFWDAYLNHDAAAKTWLNGNGPQSILQTNDRWQKK
ncbi:MAG: dienelactone hydrolase [Phycisphaerae bacterium]|nr:dienelactone hydrolase [Phycisphaerae bacterium]